MDCERGSLPYALQSQLQPQSKCGQQSRRISSNWSTKYYKTIALTVKNEQNSETKVDGNLDTAAILSGEKATLNACRLKYSRAVCKLTPSMWHTGKLSCFSEL